MPLQDKTRYVISSLPLTLFCPLVLVPDCFSPSDSYKRTWNPTGQLPWDFVCHLLGQLAFRMKPYSWLQCLGLQMQWPAVWWPDGAWLSQKSALASQEPRCLRLAVMIRKYLGKTLFAEIICPPDFRKWSTYWFKQITDLITPGRCLPGTTMQTSSFCLSFFLLTRKKQKQKVINMFTVHPHGCTQRW